MNLLHYLFKVYLIYSVLKISGHKRRLPFANIFKSNLWESKTKTNLSLFSGWNGISFGCYWGGANFDFAKWKWKKKKKFHFCCFLPPTFPKVEPKRKFRLAIFKFRKKEEKKKKSLLYNTYQVKKRVRNTSSLRTKLKIDFICSIS